eukprot:TRINITY_DN37428_c0_g1_i1.p1 TRINITY_DN37428_c0_g1~~TRINITY_DN37428_c0_g1_i1.p1  ORF type:complete len:127 (+),score=5.79 TRINITY_DN37428_c0_g1_i1:100-480(+)
MAWNAVNASCADPTPSLRERAPHMYPSVLHDILGPLSADFPSASGPDLLHAAVSPPPSLDILRSVRVTVVGASGVGKSGIINELLAFPCLRPSQAPDYESSGPPPHRALATVPVLSAPSGGSGIYT